MTGTSRAFAVSVSNFPGPRDPVRVLGADLEELLVFAEVKLDHGLRVSAASLCGAMSICVCADPSVVPDLDALAAAMGDALAELRADAA